MIDSQGWKRAAPRIDDVVRLQEAQRDATRHELRRFEQLCSRDRVDIFVRAKLFGDAQRPLAGIGDSAVFEIALGQYKLRSTPSAPQIPFRIAKLIRQMRGSSS